MARYLRILGGWGSVAIFTFAPGLLSKGNLGSPVVSVLLLVWLLGVILWCAFGVIGEADELAELLGEPLGTLILTFSIVALEVVLISASLLGGDASPTLGRDTMFAVMMIVLNGVVGLSLLVGGLRHHEQSYSLPGAVAYLGVIIPLATIALVLPTFTTSTKDGTLTTAQAVLFSAATVVLYVIFLRIQTGRHRDLFTHPDSDGHGGQDGPVGRAVASHAAVLLITALPIVLLAKKLDKVVAHGIDSLGAPVALSGILIAVIVFTPEGVSALRAAARNDVQKTVNLCLGAFLSTVGLTLPAVLTIGLITGNPVILGLSSTGVVLLSLTLLLSVVTFSGPRTTVLEGAIHLLVFFVYLVLVFSP